MKPISPKTKHIVAVSTEVNSWPQTFIEITPIMERLQKSCGTWLWSTPSWSQFDFTTSPGCNVYNGVFPSRKAAKGCGAR